MLKFLPASILALALLPGGTPQGQDNQAGFYELTVSQKMPNGVVKQQKVHVLLKKENKTLTLVDLASNRQFQGQSDQRSMSFSIKGSRYALGSPGHDTGMVTFLGSLGDDHLSGSIDFGLPETIDLKAELLNGVWACSNHNDPIHTATSEEQMRDQTAKNQCEGWHKLKATLVLK